MNGHMTQAPPPLSREIPAGVAQVVLQALQKDPRARYTSAAEMARSAREGRVVTGGIPVVHSTPPDGQTQYFGSDQTALLGAGGGNTAEQPTGAMAQPEEKGAVTPWLITAAVVAILVIIGLLIWLGDLNETPSTKIEDPTSSSSAETSEEPSPTPEQTTTDEDDDDNDWHPTTEEETSETPSETPSETQSESPSPSESPSETPTETESEPSTSSASPPDGGGGGDEGDEGGA
jgi:serine/threonine-protein kinase